MASCSAAVLSWQAERRRLAVVWRLALPMSAGPELLDWEQAPLDRVDRRRGRAERVDSLAVVSRRRDKDRADSPLAERDRVDSLAAALVRRGKADKRRQELPGREQGPPVPVALAALPATFEISAWTSAICC